jgi:hypothetical protein
VVMFGGIEVEPDAPLEVAAGPVGHGEVVVA